jgi:Rod binding domain-containing protein
MNGANSISSLVAGPPLIEGRGPKDESRVAELSKDFESVLLTKLVDEMKETVGQWGFEEEDAASGQVQGLFWLYLARDLADKGGLGLWKDLYRFFSDLQSPRDFTQSTPAEPEQSVDESL